MQTTIDMTEEQLKQLDKLSHDRHIPRNELVRIAVSTFLRIQNNPIEDSFGAWAGTHGDGVEYQRRIRDEW